MSRPASARQILVAYRLCLSYNPRRLPRAKECDLDASTNFWQTRYEFQTDAGDSLVRFDIGGFFRHSARVAIQPPALRLSELPLLITLGWYLAVMLSQDSGTAAVVVAA